MLNACTHMQYIDALYIQRRKSLNKKLSYFKISKVGSLSHQFDGRIGLKFFNVSAMLRN